MPCLQNTAKRVQSLLPACLVIASVWTAPISAADIQWVGYQNGCMVTRPDEASWFSGDNWWNYLPPGSSDTALLGSGFDPQDNGYPHLIYFGNYCIDQFACPFPISLPAANATISTLIIESDIWTFDFGSGNWQCNPAPAPMHGSLTITGSIGIGNGEPTAELTIRNGVMTSGMVFTAGGAGGSGALHITQGGQLSTGQLYNPVYHPGNYHGLVTVSGTGSVLNVTGSGPAEIGLGSATVGSVNEGSLIVEDGGLAQVQSGIFVGRAGGTGHLTLQSGGVMTILSPSAGAYIPYGQGSGVTRGDVSVTGSGSSLTIPGFINVGNGASAGGAIGSLDIADGGAVTSGPAWIAVGSGAPAGSVSVVGSESRWEIADWLRIGSTGQGSLLIESGGTVVSRFAHVGQDSQSVGSVRVAGANSSWEVSDTLRVGYRGQGHLVIDDGGVVTCGFVSLGHSAASASGEIQVSGAGSRLVTGTPQGNVNVGVRGAGILTISQGGSVEADPSGWIFISRQYESGSGTVVIADSTSSIIGSQMSVGSPEAEGLLRLISGVVDVSYTYVFREVRGTGRFTGQLRNEAGLINPGEPYGVLHIGQGFRQEAAGTLAVDIGGVAPGDSYDKLVVSGTAVLNGRLEVRLAEGFAPPADFQWEIIRADSVSGTFAEVVHDGFEVTVEYLADRVVLGLNSLTGVGDHGVPGRHGLIGAYPTPFNAGTTIRYGLAVSDVVSLRIYDVSGRLIRLLEDSVARSPGEFAVRWNGRDDAGLTVASGVYFCRMEAGAFRETRRMTLVK